MAAPSTSSYVAAHCAVSPLIGPLAQMGGLADAFASQQGQLVDKAKAASAQVFAILSASSVDEVIAMVHSDYREVLRQPIQLAAVFVRKCITAEAAMETLQQHITARTYPSYLGRKSNLVQLTAEFASSDGGNAFKAATDKRWKDYLEAQLREDLCAKKDKVTFLAKELDPVNFYPKLQELLCVCANELCYNIPCNIAA
jgi:hypothetical protein